MELPMEMNHGMFLLSFRDPRASRLAGLGNATFQISHYVETGV